MVEVYDDDFMSLIIPVSQEQLQRVASAIMSGIHNIFLPDDNNSKDLILEKKLAKGEGIYTTQKMLLGFNLNGN
jgi:hypothetical protein